MLEHIPAIYAHNIFMLYAQNAKAIMQNKFIYAPSVMENIENGEKHLVLCIVRRDKCPTSPIHLLIICSTSSTATTTTTTTTTTSTAIICSTSSTATSTTTIICSTSSTIKYP